MMDKVAASNQFTNPVTARASVGLLGALVTADGGFGVEATAGGDALLLVDARGDARTVADAALLALGPDGVTLVAAESPTYMRRTPTGWAVSLVPADGVLATLDDGSPGIVEGAPSQIVLRAGGAEFFPKPTS